MVGNVKLNGCSPMLGGWWTDMQKAIRSGATTLFQVGAQALQLYQQGRISEQDYKEIQLELAKQKSSGTDTKTILIVGGVALAALALGVIGTRK